MTARAFVDSNVLIYPFDRDAGAKRAVAKEWIDRLWDSAEGRISAQVVSETYVTITRKLKPGLAPAEAQDAVRRYLDWKPLPIDARLIDAAWRIETRWRLSWWDALIVAAAQRAECAWLLTEDLQDGQRFDDVEVVDPFRHTPDEILDGGASRVSEAPPVRRGVRRTPPAAPKPRARSGRRSGRK